MFVSALSVVGCEYLHRDLAAERARGPQVTGLEPSSEPVPLVETEPLPAEPGFALPEGAPPSQPQVIRGTGTFVGPGSVAAGGVVVGQDGEVTLNFLDVPVRDVVRAVLGEMLGLTYSIDPQVQGVISLQTSKPIGRDLVLPLLEQALQANGVALVASGEMYQAVPLAEAARRGADVATGRAPGAGQGYRIQIVPLHYVSAAEMRRVLEPFAPPGSLLQADEARNVLLLAGTDQDLRTMLETVEIFDVDWLQGMSFAIFPLHYADAETLVAELTEVFGRENSPIADIVRLVPITRMNAILAISVQPQYVEQVRDWIARLDKGSVATDRQIYVYYVQNGRAADIAGVLGQIIGAPAEGIGAGETLAGGLGEAPAPVTGGPVAGIPPETMLGTDAGEPFPGDEEGVTILTEAEPAEAAGFDEGGAAVAQAAGGLRIIADEINNAVVVYATEAEYQMVEAALRKLDIMPMQVLIEAAIAEVTLTDDLRYGVQWFFQSGDVSVTLSDVASGIVRSQFPGFSFLLATDDIRVVLNALDEETDVRVISAPQLMVLNNQTATLQVGDQVPVVTQSATSVVDTDAVVVNSVEFRDTGVILKVTPRVSEGGLVLMDISQEVSDVVPTTTSGIDSPTIRQRRINSTVAVQSGQTIALGGLIRDNATRSNRGIPGLRDLPVVGPAFGTTQDSVDRTELLVLITPRVVRNSRQARAVTDELRRRLHAVEPLQERVE